MTARVLVGDARQCLREIAHADVVITDPVWPNCRRGLLCGSGTIPLAATRMQRHGIGIEVDPEFAAVAESRFAADLLVSAGRRL